MPTFDSEQSPYALNQHSNPSSAHDPATRSAIESGSFSNTSPTAIPPLPFYKPPTRKSVSSTEKPSLTSKTNGLTGSARDDDSANPDDFYRNHQDPYRTGSMAGLGQGDIRVEKRGEARGVSSQQQRPNNVSAPVNGPKLPPLASRINTRYASSPASGSSPLSATRSSPVLSSTAQKRQTSVRELANRFNEAVDEMPPVPGGSASRSGSTSSNAGKSRRSSRSKTTSETHQRKGRIEGEMHSGRTQRSPRSPTSRPRRGNLQEELVSPKSVRFPRTQAMDLVDTMPLASQSMTDLEPRINASPRKPLFGEVFGLNPNIPDPGYGIAAARPRRTSEGSMHSPNPMFPDRAPGSEENSPTAWYKTGAPSVDDRKAEKNLPERPPVRRRALSDYEGVSKPSHPPTSNMYGTDGTHSSSPASTSTSKRNSQSRIPISTSRRPSIASDSGNSTPSTRSNSAMGHVRSPTRTSPARTRAPPPKPLQRPRSPARHSRSNTPQKSPRHIDHMTSARQDPKSPRLNAYISAPMAKKSPPLRSSRPRMPVSSASTSASRARAVERFGGASPTNRKEPRTKKPKELEGMEIDIAARKQAIQRSYTKKVGERERRHEEIERRRASMMLDSRALDPSMSSAVDGSAESKHNDSQHASQERRDQSTTDVAAIEPPVAEAPRSERELTINTSQLMDRSVLDLSMEDSPTLGTFGRFPRRGGEGPGTSLSEELEPSSAITAGTSGSVDTFFDDEPQDDSPDNSRRESRDDAVLSHIMDMRSSRSPSPTDLHQQPALDAASERDYRESIQIVLGETPVLGHSPFKEEPIGPKMKESTSSEDPDSRWSMTSFTSSNRSRDERDAPMERIDEQPQLQEHSNPKSEKPAHLSISTNSTSERTPQPWSPASFISPKTTRTTMDSDTYSTINRVLDHYHDPNLTSPEIIQDVQQHLFSTQSPVLARQGGWDPKKVTQLYLQQLSKERAAQANPQPQGDTSSTVPEAVKTHINKGSSSLEVPPSVAEKELRDDMDEKIIQPAEHKRQESAASFRSSLQHSEMDDGVDRPARASLNRPEDWDMSPSLGGYDYQALDSPIVQDEKPLPPAKDWSSLQKQLQELPDPNSRRTPQALGFRPQLPPIEGLEGLGLEINVEPPRSADTPTMSGVPPLPLPQAAPPPPPQQPTQPPPSKPSTIRSPPFPGDYGKHTSSSAYPDLQIDGEPPIPSLPPNGAARPPPSLPSSLRPSNSSGVPSLSQEPIVNGPPANAESAEKSVSPSPDQKRLIKRAHTVKELVDTEHSFCQDMKVVDDIYKGTSNVIISSEDMKTLFGNTDQIVTFSTNFLDALKHASKSVYVLAKARRWKSNRISSNTTYSGTTTDDQSSISGPELSDDDKDRKTFIGESFGHHMTSMEKVYSEYLKNHDAANQKLQALQKDEKVVIWLKECQAYARDLTSAWNLDSLLVKPVQRILKYPLLLDQLLEVTPENHPDYTALDIAAREMKGISMRINEMKKRADVMEQMNSKERKRKESDVRIGFPKAFGRRTEKLKQQVGLTDTIEDKGYAAVKHKFGEHFFQLQVVMRDTEMYCNDIQVFMSQFCDFAVAMEAHIDVAQTSYPEVESKWRKFRMLTKDMSTTALPDHISAVRKHVIAPMIQVLALHQQPEELMRKRDKKLMDYAKYKAIKDRGDKPDKKTIQQGEQFIAINDTLKDELPKLFARTGKLLHACLNNFIHLQISWQGLWRKKLRHALDDAPIPKSSREIVDAFQSDFSFFEAQVNSLSACNGAMMNETVNLLSTTTTLNGDADVISPRKAPSIERRRTMSTSSDKSPMLPQPDFGDRTNGGFFTAGDATLQAPGPDLQRQPNRRVRANSSLSGQSPQTPEIPGSYRSYSNNTTPVNTTPGRPNTSAGRTYTEPSPMRPSFEAPNINRLSNDSTFKSQRTSGTTYPPPTSQPRASGDDPSTRYSGIFSSAMPMSDSPPADSPTHGPTQKSGFNVIFLAASVYEFNIDRARKEAGYPYLTYVAGEIFDVIGEKGELWLAKNQDDASNEVGWIWNKHFVKLAH